MPEVAKEKASKLALSWHRRFCALSKSPEVRVVASSSYGSLPEPAVRDGILDTWNASGEGFSLLIYKKTGGLASYVNTHRSSARYRGRLISKRKVVQNHEQARRITRALEDIVSPPDDARVVQLDLWTEQNKPRFSDRIDTFQALWRRPTPNNIPYYWDERLGNRKLYSGGPRLIVTVDSVDSTLIDLAQAWHYEFISPHVKVTAARAVAIAKPVAAAFRKHYPRIMPYKSRAKGFKRDAAVGSPVQAELVYKEQGMIRFTSRGGTYVQERISPPTHPRIMRLVWCVRFGAYVPQDRPHFTEVNVDATTGEVVDVGI